jgi:hypothetical protein
MAAPTPYPESVLVPHVVAGSNLKTPEPPNTSQEMCSQLLCVLISAPTRETLRLLANPGDRTHTAGQAAPQQALKVCPPWPVLGEYVTWTFSPNNNGIAHQGRAG